MIYKPITIVKLVKYKYNLIILNIFIFNLIVNKQWFEYF